MDCPNKSGNDISDTEWLQIEKMVNAGIIPSAQRIKEYLVSNGLSENYDNNLRKVLCCMAAILRLEEEKPDSINSEYKKIISLLESEDSRNKIRLSLK